MQSPAVPQVWLDGSPIASGWTRDRALHYGDGLFETMMLRNGRLRFPELHAARLAEGCRRLAIPLDASAAIAGAGQLAAAAKAADGIVKLIVSRGLAVERGYAPTGRERPRQLLLHYPAAAGSSRSVPADAPCAAVLLGMRLGENPLLAGLKHLNRLELVMARAELAREQAEEGILCSQSGLLACGTQSNLFLRLGGQWLTPRVDRCGIAGVMRAVVLREAPALGLDVQQQDLPVDCLAHVEGAFVTNIRLGVQPLHRLGGRQLGVSEAVLALQRHVGQLDD
ncbi:MAG: aminodeoxychorismate lyase [Pseudomonadota bacterium]|jgi:4-amino-4-deoxychorismate lyase